MILFRVSSRRLGLFLWCHWSYLWHQHQDCVFRDGSATQCLGCSCDGISQTSIGVVVHVSETHRSTTVSRSTPLAVSHLVWTSACSHPVFPHAGAGLSVRQSAWLCLSAFLFIHHVLVPCLDAGAIEQLSLLCCVGDGQWCPSVSGYSS